MIYSKREHININVTLRLLGLLLCIEAAFMLVPTITCVVYGEYYDFYRFLISVGITAGVGLLMVAFTSQNNNSMGRREGFLLTALTWIFFSLFGALPFYLCEIGLSIPEAIFESSSGITTTGASVISDVEGCSHGILIWRAVTHLIGGMGIILFTLAVIPMLNKQSGVQLFNAEVTGITHDKVRPRISHTAKCLWAVYIVLSVSLAVFLWLGPVNFFEAICQSLSTISTGGFSTRNASIEGFNSDYVKIVISVYMLLAGINFALLFNLAIGKGRALFKNDTFRWYIAIVFFAFLFIVVDLFINGEYTDIKTLIVDTFFQVTSAITSTGFTGSHFTLWKGASIIILVLLMLVGSCAGSTAGGLKIDRLMIIIKNAKNELYKILHPNTVMPLRANGKIISPELITKTGALLMIFLIINVIGSSILICYGFDTFDALFASISCTCNNGLGYGVTASNFASIPDVPKIIMSFFMIVGRLEVFTIIIIFTKAFWNKE